MKRKRTVDETLDLREREFYNRDEVLLLTTQLQLEYNRAFDKPRSNLVIYRYAATQTNVETIAKINIVLQACLTENIFKSYEEIREIIESTINV